MPYRPSPLSVVLALALPLAGCSPNPNAQSYAVEEAPLAKISGDLAGGKTTSVSVTRAYIARIKTYDGALHAVIAVAPDALDQAAASDKRRKEGKVLGPMDGVPVLLKDNIDAVGMPTTAGSFALAENLPARDSEVARRLRAAGAVILGKANTSQWAGLRTTSGFNGSTVGGSPKNPYDLTRSPAGSSSGPGIAAAASLAAATVGTDTTGSIISPSSYNGVVGIRPTVALISRRGIVPVSLTQDTSGPMARSVTDTAMMLSVLAGSDAGDPASKDADAHKADYVKSLDAGSLKGKRLGVLRGTRDYSEATRVPFDKALEVLKAQGAELVEIPEGVLQDISQEDRIVLLYDFKEDIAAYLATTSPDKVKTRTLADLIAFNKSDPRESSHDQDLFDAAEATAGRQDQAYIDNMAAAKRMVQADGLDKALKDYNVSALVALTRGPPEPIVPDNTGGGHPIAQHDKGATPPSTSQIAALAGYPDLTVPMGLLDGLPVGISFMGPPWSEPMLLAYGYAYEQASHARVPPQAYKKAAAK
ncbi:MAG: amidase [Rhodospirillaceae bacterium]|nr:amidase [Rhodospirillaceae bacterium]